MIKAFIPVIEEVIALNAGTSLTIATAIVLKYYNIFSE